jgi:hypothetical protein
MGLLRNSETLEVEEENELESVALDLLISHMTMTQNLSLCPKGAKLSYSWTCKKKKTPNAPVDLRGKQTPCNN